ncbi:MAG: hypothetical protein H6981_04580 [Gammaproteobacteria bacterium]|nr:hypothetical protein [Gammaproteobacteria bacterium]
MTDQAIATLDTARAAAYVAGEGFEYEHAVAAAAEAWQGMERDAMAFGVHILAIKKQSEHGQYLAALKRLSVAKSTAHRFAARAEVLVFNNLAANVPTLGHLPGVKLDALVKLDRRQREEIIDAEAGTIAGVPIEEAAKLSTRQFRALVGAGAGAAPKGRRKKNGDDVANLIRTLGPEDRRIVMWSILRHGYHLGTGYTVTKDGGR